MKSPAMQQFFLLFMILFTGMVFPSAGQVTEFPYEQGFESAFATGEEAEFLPFWRANEVSNGAGRVFQAGAAEARSGEAALGAVPTGSFSADIHFFFNAGSLGEGEISFWARSAQNGSGSRPAEVLYSFSGDGGKTFTEAVIIGEEAAFPNRNTDYREYKVGIPDDLKESTEAVLRLQVKRGTGGEGTSATVLIDDFRISGEGFVFRVIAAKALNQNQMEVLFNNKLNKKAAESAAHYQLNQEGEIKEAALDQFNNRRVLLTTGPRREGVAYTLRVGEVLDVEGNSAEGQEVQVLPATADRENNEEVNIFELLISEIHASPNDHTLLPKVEWVEIFNASGRPVQLEGMLFADESRAVTLPAYVLQAGAYIILAPQSAVGELEIYGETAGLKSWPALNNDGDILSLYTGENKLIDRISYSQNWYQNSIKSQGGWSLERIDLNHPCAGAANWTASVDGRGGTPGGSNSVAAAKPDNTGPELKLAFVQDSLHIQLVFNEALDTTQLASLHLELHPPGPGIQAVPLKDLPDKLLLRFGTPVDSAKDYQISISNLTDCSGNLMEPVILAEVAFPRKAKESEMVLNEIMYDPAPGSEEWVEIANITEHYLDLQNWQLATFDGGIKSSVVLSRDRLILPPNDFLVFSRNISAVKSAFPAGPEENFLQLPAMPALSNSGDTLVLINPEGKAAEEFGYHKNLHSSFAKETKGISLERINPAAPAGQEGNWTSAAGTAGFGTPGMPNSQRYKGNIATQENGLLVQPEVIIPGSESLAAFATISFKAHQPGMQATLKIFDTEGREIRTLAHNQLLGTEGFYTWDGTTEEGGGVRMGYYIVFLHLYGQNGYNRTFRKTIVVGK